MKITTVSLSRTIPTGAYENLKVGMEADLESGESEFDALNKLSHLINDWYGKQYREGIPDKLLVGQGSTKVFSEPPYSPPPVIQTEKTDPTDTLTLIQNAPDMTALSSFKLLASNNPDLYKAYCSRIKSLAETK
jgi:hypothetical protein